MNCTLFYETYTSQLACFDFFQALPLVRHYLLSYFFRKEWYEIFKDYLFVLFCYKVFSTVCYQLRIYGPLQSIKIIFNDFSKGFFKVLLNSRFLKGIVNKQVDAAKITMERQLIKNDDCLEDYEFLPKLGIPENEILNQLDMLQDVLPRAHWEEGKVSGAVYHGGGDLIRLQSEAFEKYCVANQLHPDVFPGVRKMEAEVVSMTLNMFNAPSDTGCGATTSGGTESLLLACLSAKMYAFNHRNVTAPEMIVPTTAHAGFNKASYYFGIKMIHVDVNPITYQVELKQVKKFINKNTILLVGSAPNFPHGIIDDIEGLGKIAESYKIPLHVDCCLGSFIVAFMGKSGYADIPLFDFRVPGVTSISCDTHKYGFAPKGSSIIMYRNSELRMHQYYVTTDWVGGLYGSPTLAGSRPGALVVGCWATMINIGEDGYIISCTEIIGAARKFRAYIESNIPELQIVGDPKCSVISFKSDIVNVYDLADRLAKRGWHLSSLQNPAALHIAVTKLSVSSIDELSSVLTEEIKLMKQDPNAKSSSDGTSALYGVAGSITSTGVADKLIVGFLDALYKLNASQE